MAAAENSKLQRQARYDDDDDDIASERGDEQQQQQASRYAREAREKRLHG